MGNPRPTSMSSLFETPSFHRQTDYQVSANLIGAPTAQGFRVPEAKEEF